MEEAVSPHVAPAIGAEQSFDGLFGMAVSDIDRSLVDQERQRIVRDQAVVLKDKTERLDVRADDRHGNLRNRRVGKRRTAPCPPLACYGGGMVGTLALCPPYKTALSASCSLCRFPRYLEHQAGRGGVRQQAALGVGDARLGGGGATADVQRPAFGADRAGLFGHAPDET